MIWIDRQQQLDQTITKLKNFDTLALDTEADSLHSYFDKVCLIQVTAGEEDILIDPLAKIDLSTLGGILADRSIRKILHGSDYDLRILNRDFGMTIANLFDTMICAQLLGLPGVGLAALLKHYFDVDVDKSHQRANWAMRPLTPQMLRYATIDTHYLIPLAGRLEEELRQLGRWSWAQEEFARLEEVRFREPEVDEEAFRRVKGSNRLSRRGLAMLRELFNWRDRQARAADRPPFKVLGNETMLEISTSFPATLPDLAAIKGMPASILRRHGNSIVTMVRAVLDIPEEALPEKVASRPWMRDHDLERRVERLKRTRDRVAGELKIDPSILAPRHVLSAIAGLRPTSVEQLEEVSTLRRWQRELIGAELVRESQPRESGQTSF